MDSSKMEVDLVSWINEGNGVDFTQGAKDAPSLDSAWCTPPPNQDLNYDLPDLPDLPAWMENREDVGIENDLFGGGFSKGLDWHENWVNYDPPTISLADPGETPGCATQNYETLTGNEVPTSSLSSAIPVSTVPVPTVPVTSVPVSSVPVSSVPVSSVPVSSVPISSVPISSVPISSVPISTVPVSTVPVSTVPISTVPISTVPVSSVPVSSVPVSSVPVSTVPALTVLPSSAMVTSPLTILPTSSKVASASGNTIVNNTSTSTPRMIIKVLKVNVPSKSKGVHIVPSGSIYRVQTDVKPDHKPEGKTTCVQPILPQSNCLLTPPQSPENKLSLLNSDEYFTNSDAHQLLDELVNMVDPENAELDSSVHTLDDTNELLSHLDSDASESEPPSPSSSESYSLSPFSPGSPDTSIPSLASSSKAGSSCGKAKSSRSRRSEPYIVDSKLRKKEQNKRAALRYRQKKKQEEDDVAILLKEEQDRQDELKNKYKDLKQELGYLKKLMKDVLVAKGVVSAEAFK